MQLILRRLRDHRIDVITEHLLLRCQPFFESGFCRRGRLLRQRQRDAAAHEHFIGDMQEIGCPGHAHVGHGLIQDFPGLHWRHADVERAAQHGAVFVHRLAGDQRRQVHHLAQMDVHLRGFDHLIECPVVENLDQLGIGDLQCGYVIGEKLLVIPLRCFGDSHRVVSRSRKTPTEQSRAAK